MAEPNTDERPAELSTDKRPAEFDLSRTVKVTNISERVTARLLKIFFEPCGQLTSVYLARDWVLVEFATVRAVGIAVHFSGAEFLRREVTIERARPFAVDAVLLTLLAGQRDEGSALSKLNERVLRRIHGWLLPKAVVVKVGRFVCGGAPIVVWNFKIARRIRVDPRNAQTFADLASLVVEHLSTVGFSKDDSDDYDSDVRHQISERGAQSVVRFFTQTEIRVPVNGLLDVLRQAKKGAEFPYHTIGLIPSDDDRLVWNLMDEQGTVMLNCCLDVGGRFPLRAPPTEPAEDGGDCVCS